MKFPGYCVGLHGVTAMDSAVLLQGRPKGGVLLIYYPDSINGNAKPIKNLFDRLCALSCQVDCIHYIYFVSICHVIVINQKIGMNLIKKILKYCHYVFNKMLNMSVLPEI